tara:strand:+ start:120 stop:1124 length:1005 start_codon:yes stop_codon:yes gene_type:complete
MDNEKKSSEDKSQMDKGSFIDDLKLLLKKHFGSKLKASANNFKLNKKHVTSVKALFSNKGFRKFLVPAVAIGLIINANLSSKNQVSKKELMWPVDWKQFSSGWPKMSSGVHNFQAISENYPCYKDDTKSECETKRKERTVFFQKNLRDACINWAAVEKIFAKYNNEEYHIRRKFNDRWKQQKEQFEDSKKQVFKNRTPSKIEEERLIKVLLKREILPKNFFRERQRVKNESKSLSDMMQKLYYPIVSAWVEVARQSGDENWQYYSRISVNGVGDLILKHIDAKFVGLLTKEEYSEKDQEMRIKLKDAKKSMRSICSPWVDWLYQDGYLIDYDNR